MFKNSIIFILVIFIFCYDKILNNKKIDLKCCEQSEIYRYKIILGDIAVKQAYMIDTKTGRVWHEVFDSRRHGEPLFWAEYYVEVNVNRDYTYEMFNSFYPLKNLKDKK